MSKQRFPNAIDQEMGAWMASAARSDLSSALSSARAGQLATARSFARRAASELHEAVRFTKRQLIALRQ